MQGRLDSARVRIGVPDARSAFRLERRLQALRAVAVGRGPRWEVDLETYDGDPAAIAAAVEDWLADDGLMEAIVRVDGDERCVVARR